MEFWNNHLFCCRKSKMQHFGCTAACFHQQKFRVDLTACEHGHFITAVCATAAVTVTYVFVLITGTYVTKVSGWCGQATGGGQRSGDESCLLGDMSNISIIKWFYIRPNSRCIFYRAYRANTSILNNRLKRFKGNQHTL